MKHRYLIGGFLALVLVAALVYFYGGSQAPSGQPPLKSLTAQNVAEVKSELQRGEGRCSRAPAFVPNLTDMSAGGLCNRAHYAGVCAEAGASFCHLGTGTADGLVIAFHGDTE